MTTASPDERLDEEIRRFLDRRWRDVAAAPTADEVLLALESGWPRPTGARRRAMRVVPVLATAALAVTVVASVVFVGSQRRAEVSPRPTDASPGPSRFVSSPALSLGWSTVGTEIGQLSWAPIQGGSMKGIFETPRGYASINESGYQESNGGVIWHEAQPPVAVVGSFGHVASESGHWIWSPFESRAWRSPDYATWTEVDLGMIAPMSSGGRLFLGQPVDDGSTVVIPWEHTATTPPETGLLIVTDDRTDTIARPWQADATLAVIDGRFVALRAAGSVTAPWGSPLAEAGLWKSDDGRAWSFVGTPDLPLSSTPTRLVAGPAIGAPAPFVALVGYPWAAQDLWGSDDGLTWRWLSSTPGPAFVVDRGLVAIDHRGIHVAVDGQDWSLVESSATHVPTYWDPYEAGAHSAAVPDGRGVTWLIRVEPDG